jgi:feruloyl esterase
MNHCGGGDGPNRFDMLSALEQWREQGKAPDAMLPSHESDGKVDHTRPLCPYPAPATAKYKGTGSTSDTKNFSCARP